MSDSMHVFDRGLVRRHRERAAANFAQADFLVREGAERLADRLNDVARAFPRVLDLGCHTGQMGRLLAGHPKVGTLFQGDLSPAMARLARAANTCPTVCADEEFLPF